MVRPIIALFVLAALALPACAGGTTAAPAEYLWWTWPLGLFVVCFFLGIVAVPAGVGGGVLFVPIVGGLPASVKIKPLRFTTCDASGRIYWEGSHWRRMRALLDAAETGGGGR